MAYSVEYSETARKQLRKLDPPVARRIVLYLDDVAESPDPRSRGKGLAGDRSGIWRYRVGDYRALCEIRDAELIILTLEIGHRSTIYSN